MEPGPGDSRVSQGWHSPRHGAAPAAAPPAPLWGKRATGWGTGTGAIPALRARPQPQLTGQEQQQLPQALLVQLQGVTVVPAFLLLQEPPGGSSSPLSTRFTPSPSLEG